MLMNDLVMQMLELYTAKELQRPTNSVPSFTALHKKPTMHELTAQTNGVPILSKQSPEHEVTLHASEHKLTIYASGVTTLHRWQAMSKITVQTDGPKLTIYAEGITTSCKWPTMHELTASRQMGLTAHLTAVRQLPIFILSLFPFVLCCSFPSLGNFLCFQNRSKTFQNPSFATRFKQLHKLTPNI